MPLLQRLSRVVPVTVLAVLACWAATRNNDDDCGTVGECLGTAFDDAITLLVVIPLTGIALRLLRTGRAGFHTLALLVVGGSLWYGTDALLRTLDPARPYDALVPLPLAVVIGVVTGAAATYVVGPGGGRTVRVAAVVVALAFPVVTQLASDSAEAQYDVDRIEALGITAYAPVVDGHPPEYAYPSEDSVRLSYSLERGGETTFVYVTLLRAPSGSLCEVDRLFAGPECTQAGDAMRDISTGFANVGLVRGDTALIAEFDAAALDPDDLLTALREAPVVDAEDLG